jgi:hypothetical protein
MVVAESLNGHSFMVFSAPPSGSLAPLLSHANDADMNHMSLPFSTEIFEL